MHEGSTRAWQNRRQASATIRGFLAAVLVLAGLLPTNATTPGSAVSEQPEANAGLSPITPAYDASILLVENGHEGVQLSARLAEGSEPLQHGIIWKVSDASGLMLSETTAPATSLDLPPGSYQIQASYGSARYRRTVDLEPGQRLELSFLLNAGALRILATVQGLATDRPATNLIYASSGPDRGRLVTISKSPGEVLPLAAGTYRLESRLEPGNAVLVTDVTVRPGIVSAVSISHRAGLMRFSYAGSQPADVRWQVLASSGQVLLQLKGIRPSAVLKPGSYLVEMQAAGTMSGSRFELSAGEEKSLQLGR